MPPRCRAKDVEEGGDLPPPFLASSKGVEEGVKSLVVIGLSQVSSKRAKMEGVEDQKKCFVSVLFVSRL